MLRQRPVGHEARLAHSLTSETGHECCVGLCRTDVVGTGERPGLAAMCRVARLGCGTRVDWECVSEGRSCGLVSCGGSLLQHLCTLAALLI